MKKIIRISNPGAPKPYIVTPSGSGYGREVPGSKIQVAPESMRLHRIFYRKDQDEAEKIIKELLKIVLATSTVELVDLPRGWW